MIQDSVEQRESGTPAPLVERVRSLRLPKGNPGRGPRAGWVPWAICSVFATSTAVLGYMLWSRQPAEPERSAASGTEIQSAAAASAAPTASSGSVALDSKGYITPVRQILVSPKINGMIVKSYILEGKHVKKGEVLAKLEDDDYQADFHRALATLELARHRLAEIETSEPKEIGAAEADLSEARAQLVQLKSDYERSKDLFENKQVLTKQDFELAESKYLAHQQRVRRLDYAVSLIKSSRAKRIAAAQAEVGQAEAERAKAKWRLDNCIICAPITGTILKKNAEEGNVVNPIAFAGSTSLCELADLSDLEVEVTIQERDISKVYAGQKCRVRAEAYPDRVYQGVVSRLMPIADRAKGAIPVRVKVTVPREEEGVYLKPEMGAIVSFLNEKKA
jgi:HlyD family secretion protein